MATPAPEVVTPVGVKTGKRCQSYNHRETRPQATWRISVPGQAPVHLCDTCRDVQEPNLLRQALERLPEERKQLRDLETTLLRAAQNSPFLTMGDAAEAAGIKRSNAYKIINR